MPDESERIRINETIYSADGYKKRYFQDKRFFKRWSKSKLKLIEKWKPNKGNLLDIGCSYGFFLESAKSRGWNVSGAEINSVTGNYARENFGDEIFIGGVERSYFKRSSFDVITLWDVIEHVPDPVAYLKMVQKYLKSDGLLCIQVPNIESFISSHEGSRWDWLTPGDHRYFFSPETLTNLLASAGLSVKYLTTWEPHGYFIDTLFGFNKRNNFLMELYRKTIVRFLRKIMFFVFIPWQRMISIHDKGALIITLAGQEQDGKPL